MRTALLYNFLIEANIMASIAILLMAALRKLLRRPLGNTALCFGWLLIAARLLLPLSLPNPLINAIRSPFAMDAAIRPIAGQVKVRLSDAVTDLALNLWNRPGGAMRALSSRVFALEASLDNASLSIRLAHLYVLGVLAVIVWYAVSNARFRHRLRAGRIEPISGRLLEQYRALCAARGVKPVPVCFTDPLPSACLVGVFRPYIALPLTAVPQDVIHVLTHEVCHLKNRDPWWGLLRLACCALHWFNPLVWMAAAMSRTDSELRCDDRVTAPMNRKERQAYANVLVLAAARRNAPGLGVLATGMTMTSRRLRTRVTSVLRGGKPLRALAVAFALTASVCLFGAFATGEMRVRPRLKQRDDPAVSRGAITNESEAVAFARMIYGLADGGVSESDQRWTVENAPDNPEACAAYMQDGDGATRCEMVFDRAGNVEYLFCEPEIMEDWTEQLNLSLSVDEQAKLADDLLRLGTQLHPALAARCQTFRFVHENLGSHGGRTVGVCFWGSPDDETRNEPMLLYFQVQLYPAVRVLGFTIHQGSPDGNG